MNISQASTRISRFVFRASRAAMGFVRGGQITSFGFGKGKISQILIINLDRQPDRLRRTLRELRRFTTADDAPLDTLAHRLAAVDARDGRAVAATADVDPMYRLRDQLFVQPDARLAACFDGETPVKMTRQEVAVARSHVEAWKFIAGSSCEHVLVLEDDVWFRAGAAAAISRGWNAAMRRRAGTRGAHMLYFSYDDAGGTALRADVGDGLFRPERGLWFLSGYVLSRDAAEYLLRAMPVVGPVDMWMNYRFGEMDTLALSVPAILQRPDSVSDNLYSVLPFLARAGIVDSDAVPAPAPVKAGPVLAWSAGRDNEQLAMALSMLGLRVRVYDGDEEPISAGELMSLLGTFDALVDAPLDASSVAAAVSTLDVKFVFEPDARSRSAMPLAGARVSSTALLSRNERGEASWQPICMLLGLGLPVHAFPRGAPRALRLFRDDRRRTFAPAGDCRWADSMDDTAWALVPRTARPSIPRTNGADLPLFECILHETMGSPSAVFTPREETFPGNLAAFSQQGVLHKDDCVHLVLDSEPTRGRRYRSGALASTRPFFHGRFEVEIRAARGKGLITGFFLHRDAPRQEIDVELTGDSPCSMLVNVYFNPGDDGAAMVFGYRGSPCRIDLDFDATLGFHSYAIDWRPGCIAWSVDGKVVHERVGWDPTPIPHLPMHVHANLWAPRGKEVAGELDERVLPASAAFRSLRVWA